MSLTKNAIGNLINRYKAVLKKCDLMNTFGSLAVAGMLVMGGAGLAIAADIDDTTVSDKEVTLEGDLKGTLTIEGTGIVNVGPGKIIAAEENDRPATITMTGGTLNVNGTYAEALQLDITGGTVNIKGKDFADWREYALGGYSEEFTGDAATDSGKPTLVSGKNTVVNIENANLFGGAFDTSTFDTKTSPMLTITDGATVNLKGNGMLFAGNSLKGGLLISEGAVVNASAGKNYINAGLTVVEAATVNIDKGATLVVTPYLGDGDNFVAPAGNKAQFNLGADAILANAGTLSIVEGTTAVFADGSKVTNSGTIENKGTVSIATDMTLEGTWENKGSIAIDEAGAGDVDVTMTRKQLADLTKEGLVSVQGNRGDLKHSSVTISDSTAIFDLNTDFKNDGSKGLQLLGYGSVDGKNVVLNGSKLALGDTSLRIRAATGLELNSDSKADPKTFTLESGTLKLAGGNLSSSNGTTDLVSKDHLVFGDKDDGGNGTIGLNVTVANGSTEVRANEWTLASGKTISVTKTTDPAMTGSLTIGGSSAKAVLDVSGGKLTSGAGTTITIDTNGVLKAKNVDFLTGDLTASAATISKATTMAGSVTVADGGILQIVGYANKEILIGKATDAKTAIGAVNGLIEYVDAKIVSGTTAPISQTDAKAAGAIINGDVDGGDGTDIVGGYGANSIATTATDAATIKAGEEITLLGNKTGDIVTNKDSEAVETLNVADGATLNLGTATQAGNVNTTTDIKLATATSSVNAINGDKTVGDITGAGKVSATDGKLIAESIGTYDAAGDPETPVAMVDASKGDITSNNGIYTTSLKVGDDQVVLAKAGDITVGSTTPIADVDGTIRAEAGSVTLSGGITSGTGTVDAAKDIVATGQDLIGDIDATNNKADLDLNAGKDITAAAIKADNVVAGGTVTATGAVDATSKLDAKAVSAVGQNVTVGVAGEKGNSNVFKIQDTSTMGKLEVNGATSNVDGALTVAGADISAGEFTATKEIASSATVEFRNGVNADLDTLTMTAAANVLIGRDDKALDSGNTIVSIKKLGLGGGNLVVDPAWGADPSNAAVEDGDTVSKTDITVNGNIGVGRNSMLALGTKDTSLLPRVLKDLTGVDRPQQGGYEAVLGLAKKLEIHSGNVLLVDNAQRTSAEWATALATQARAAASGGPRVVFGDQSALVVDARIANGAEGAINYDSHTPAKAEIADTSSLVVINAESKKTYTILGDSFTAAPGNIDMTANKGWYENTITDNKMVNIKYDVANNGKVTTTTADPTSVMPGLESELASLIKAGYDSNELGGTKAYNGEGDAKFLSRLTHRDFMNGGTDAAKAAEGAARLIAIAGVPQMAMSANNAAAGAVLARTSIGSLINNVMAIDSKGNVQGAEKGANSGDELGMSAGNGYAKSGVGMWIMPLWQSTNNFGMKAGNFDMDMSGSIGGIALGVDYTFEQAIRAGITFNIGGGYADGSGDYAKTENRMNFWGLGAYVSGAFNNFGVTADVNYTSTYNDIEQELDSRMGMGKLKTDVRSSVLSAGLQGEYKIVTDMVDIMPHVGVRFMHLSTEDYDVKAGGQKVYKGDGLNQSIWTFPIGVQFSKDVALDNGWYVKPMLDLNVTPAAGELEAKNDIRFTGVSGTAQMETQVMDYITYGGKAGLEFGNENVKLGVNYNLQMGAHTTNHGVFGTFRYEF